MAQLDDDIGLVMQKLKDMGEDDNTIVVFTTDNGTETLHLARWRHRRRSRSAKGTIYRRRLPRAVHRPLARPHPGGHGAEWPHLRPGLVPDLRSPPPATPNITDDLLKGMKIGDRTYKNHLDGYNQMDMITGKGPSKRHEIFYLGESTLGAVRIDDYKYPLHRPAQGLARREDPSWTCPNITNLRLDPFERMGWPNNGTKDGAQGYFDWFKYEFWRFVFVQQVVAQGAPDVHRVPADAEGASFNLDAVKAEMAKRMAQAEAASKGPGQ